MRHDIAQKESRDSCFCHNPSPPPSVNVGDLALASDNMTCINIKLGERGVTFLLNQVKFANNFFHDCGSVTESNALFPWPHLHYSPVYILGHKENCFQIW